MKKAFFAVLFAAVANAAAAQQTGHYIATNAGNGAVRVRGTADSICPAVAKIVGKRTITVECSRQIEIVSVEEFLGRFHLPKIQQQGNTYFLKLRRKRAAYVGAVWVEI